MSFDPLSEKRRIDTIPSSGASGRPVARPDGAAAGASGRVRYTGDHLIGMSGSGGSRLESDLSKKYIEAPGQGSPACVRRIFLTRNRLTAAVMRACVSDFQ